MTMEMTANHTSTKELANLAVEHSQKGVAAVPKPTAVLALSPPDFFEVSYAINPWMQPTDWQSRAAELFKKAENGWNAMRETFEQEGIAVHLLPAKKGLPDMVFTANSAVVLNRKALLARFRYPERQGEEKQIDEFFKVLKAQGLIDEFEMFPEGIFQEGAGDCHWDPYRELFWAGYGPRSKKEAIPIVEKYFGKPVVALELESDTFYHMDMSLCPLSGGDVIYYPQAFKEHALPKLLERIPEDKRVAITKEDADNFSANAVNVGRKVFMSKCTESLEARLKERGYSVFRLPVEAFGMSGGSVFCMTLRLDWNSKS